MTKRQIVLLTIVLLALTLLTLFLAPGDKNLGGSTYGRSPGGYGAWYTFMEQRGTPVKRWQQPLNQLPGMTGTPPVTTIQTASPTNVATNMTLLRISDDLSLTDGALLTWVRQGNVLILLGVRSPVTAAPFRNAIASPVGTVLVDTKRRGSAGQGRSRLDDRFGAVVWQEAVGKGQVIYGTTPYLAANAYQGASGNFEFLATLVAERGYSIWVDEYMHGYKDESVIQTETATDLLGYLAKTPLLLVALQTVIILLIAVWGHNQRLGRAIALTSPMTDNSTAYIQALASVLHKATCSEFVVETIGKAEQLALQKSLGLGSEPVPPEILIDAWVQQTGQPAAELETVLRTAQRHRRISDSDLLRWLARIQTVRQHLPD